MARKRIWLGRKVGRFSLYFGWNGPVYWLHVAVDPLFSLTVGQKSPKSRKAGRRAG